MYGRIQICVSVHMNVEAKGGHPLSFSTTLCLILLDTKPEHAGLVVGWLVSELPGSTSLCQTKMGFLVDVATPRLLHGCRGFKLRISCLHSTHSYPLHPCCLALALLLLLIYFPQYSSAPPKQRVHCLSLCQGRRPVLLSGINTFAKKLISRDLY